MIRRATFTAPDPRTLERLAVASRVLGLPAGKPTHALLRDTFFDTTDGVLRDRRVTLRVRVQADGSQSLVFTETSAVSLSGIWEEVRISTPVVGEGLYSTLAADSEVARRVCALTDPVALRPQAAVDVDREVRDLRSGILGGPVHQIYLDRMLAHVQGITRPQQELTLLELTPGEPTLEALARRLTEEEELINDGLDVVERLRQEAVGAREWSTSADPDATLGLALLLVREDGRVALTRAGNELVFPATLASGDGAAADYAERVLPGAPRDDPERLGFAPVAGPGPDLELWYQPVDPPAPDAVSDLLWIPLDQLLERVGVPRLRSPALIACLTLLVRSGTAERILPSCRRGPEPPTPLPVLPRSAGHAPGDDPGDWLEQKLSIMDFNARVLELAEDPGVPLLERFRFLSIFSANMDEFFVVRVGRIKVRVEHTRLGSRVRHESELILDAMAVRSWALFARQYRCLRDDLLPALAERGRGFRRWAELDEEQQAVLGRHYRTEIFPLLTPRSMTPSPGQPFPRLENLELSLAVVLRDEERDRTALAHVGIPGEIPRLLLVPGTRDLILMEEVVRAHLPDLFPAVEVVSSHAFRISRYQDVEIDEGVEGSLLDAIADEVEARPFKPVIRIEVDDDMPQDVRAFLLRELRTERGTGQSVLNRSDVYEAPGPLDLGAFSELVQVEPEGEVWKPFPPARPVGDESSIFDRLDRGDLLVHHPYDAFDDTVGRLLREAARDPAVVAIKLTLYRTGRDSPVMEALLEALERGKEVTVFVELKARFDEESNITWTHRLTEAGGHVVYGLVGFKTHAKTALVVRRGEGGELHRYVHVGTGNYNAATARLYTDLGLLSADPELGGDLNDFFNELTGSAGPPLKDYHRLWVAPNSLARELLAAIEDEIRHARAGRPARVRAKMNGLSDRKVAKALCRASQAGVEVELVVRAMCTLRPGVPGLSERIHVRSLLGRFLEHARIYHFENGGRARWFIGSADWRKRNLRRRVEVVTSVTDPDAQQRLSWILDTELADPRAWVLRGDGAWERLAGEGPTAQERFMEEAGARGEGVRADEAEASAR